MAASGNEAVKLSQLSNLMIKPGDVLTMNSLISAGFITGSLQRMYFCIPFNRPISSKCTGADLTVAKVTVRGNGQYLTGWNDQHDAIADPEISIVYNPFYPESGLLAGYFLNSGTFHDISNNSQVVLRFEYLEVTFK